MARHNTSGMSLRRWRCEQDAPVNCSFLVLSGQQGHNFVLTFPGDGCAAWLAYGPDHVGHNERVSLEPNLHVLWQITFDSLRTTRAIFP